MPPGSGDCHWVILKMESMIKKRFGGAKPNIYIWSQHPSRDRCKGYIDMLPFVRWGGYYDARRADIAAVGHQVFSVGKPFAIDKWNGFDLFVAFNKPLENGVQLADIMPNLDVNWDYELRIPEKELAWAREFHQQHGPYVVAWFCNRSFYTGWLKKFEVKRIESLLRIVRNRGMTVVLTGREWDRDFMTKLRSKDDMNLAGLTSLPRFLALCKYGNAFLGHAAGNGMLAQHIGTRTFMLWDPKQWTKKFMTNWVNPSSLKTVYHPMPITDFMPEHYLDKHL